MTGIYEQVLAIAREQANALAAGELERAVALLDRRAELLAGAPPPSKPEVPLVEEVLKLDRELATAIRYRMIAIRDEARAGQQGRQALQGYSRVALKRARGVNIAG
jgi:hypothetical protein